jgi:hypothetical protein
MAFVSVYRMGDVLALNLSKPMILALGYTKTQIGWADGAVALGSSIIGVGLGGWMVTKWRWGITLSIGAFFAALGNFGFVWLAHMPVDQNTLYFATAADQFGNGMAGAVFVVYLSMLVNPRFPGAQYAFLSGFRLPARAVACRGGRIDRHQARQGRVQWLRHVLPRLGRDQPRRVALPAAADECETAPRRSRTGGRMIDAAFAPAAAAVADGRIPGATLGMVAADGRRWVRHAGKAALVPEPEDLTEEHWFDLASVSKVIATTTMILRSQTRGSSTSTPRSPPRSRSAPIRRGAAERKLTFRDCLAHRTFFPAVEPIYTYGDDPARLRAFVLQREWRHGPPVYSDINFILLGIAIERITGQPLGAWPLGEGLSFGPPPGPAVATEHCMWRGRVLKGEVHDENCFAMGGQTGHAGLFGTVAGVLDFALGLLDGSGASPGDARGDPHAAIRAPHLRLGAEIPWLVGRPGVLGRDDRPYRLHRHRPVGRFRARPCLDPAHQSRPPHPPSRQLDLQPLRPETGDAVVSVAW